MATLYFSDEAEADLFEHWEYQVGQAGPDAADRLIDTLKATCETTAMLKSGLLTNAQIAQMADTSLEQIQQIKAVITDK